LRMWWFLNDPLIHIFFAKEVLNHVVACPNVWSQLKSFKASQTLCLYEIYILTSVLILLVCPFCKVKIIVRSIILIVIVLRDAIAEIVLNSKAKSSLVGPAASHILDGVAASTKHKQGNSPVLDNLNHLTMALDSAVVSSELIISDRISSTLDDHSIWAESLSHLFHNL
jgi:hypothetical protein